jgi:hypothetical protein
VLSLQVLPRSRSLKSIYPGPSLPPTSDETPEGHVLRYNAQGEVIGLTIINAKWLLERDHVINVTVPDHVAVSPDTLAEALAAA